MRGVGIERSSEEESLTRGLSGLELQHDLHLLLKDWSAWNGVSDALKSAGAEICNLQLARHGDAFAARCRLKRLSSDEARSVSHDLVESGLALRSSVEHLMLAHSASAERKP